MLADGAETPASILYNGTTYLPMRKLGELSRNKIYRNGDSRTAYMTGPQKDIEVITEKPDKNGNVWKYYTFKDSSDKSYLGVKDEARGYERVYRIESNTVQATDNEIYFVRYIKKESLQVVQDSVNIVGLPFECTVDEQDGEVLKSALIEPNECIADGAYVFYLWRTMGTMAHSNITVYNCMTGEIQTYYGITMKMER